MSMKESHVWRAQCSTAQQSRSIAEHVRPHPRQSTAQHSRPQPRQCTALASTSQPRTSAQPSAAKHSTGDYSLGMAQRSKAKHSTAQHSTAQHSTAQPGRLATCSTSLSLAAASRASRRLFRPSRDTASRASAAGAYNILLHLRPRLLTITAKAATSCIHVCSRVV